MTHVDELLLDDITLGSAILGSGGGGDPYIGLLLARSAIQSHGAVQLTPLNCVPDDALVAFIASIGAPGVLIEKLPRTEDAVDALAMLSHHLRQDITHLCPIEAGGLNAVIPFGPAAIMGLPVIDADGMGRAFPGLDMVTPTLNGGTSTPMAFADEHGNRSLLLTETNAWSETLGRVSTVASGCTQFFASYPMTGRQAKQWLIDAPLSRAARLGRIVRSARAEHRSPVDAVLAQEGGIRLLDGKVVSVERRNEGGFTLGEAVIEGTGAHAGSTLRLKFQNEYLIAERDGRAVGTTPDILATLEIETGEPIMAEDIRYGYRVATIGLPCDDRWRTTDGIELVGPRRFGYDVDYRPVEGGARE